MKGKFLSRTSSKVQIAFKGDFAVNLIEIKVFEKEMKQIQPKHPVHMFMNFNEYLTYKLLIVGVKVIVNNSYD